MLLLLFEHFATFSLILLLCSGLREGGGQGGVHALWGLGGRIGKTLLLLEISSVFLLTMIMVVTVLHVLTVEELVRHFSESLSICIISPNILSSAHSCLLLAQEGIVDHLLLQSILLREVGGRIENRLVVHSNCAVINESIVLILVMVMKVKHRALLVELLVVVLVCASQTLLRVQLRVDSGLGAH